MEHAATKLTTAAGLLAASLLSSAPAARAESAVYSTVYPAPVGVYHKLVAKKIGFLAYETRDAMQVPPMPEPGTLAYCRETENYYASAADANPADAKTWWKAFSFMEAENILARGSLESYRPTSNAGSWVKTLLPEIGLLYYYQTYLRSRNKLTKRGTYTAYAVGRVCENLPAGSTRFVGATNAVIFALSLRFNGVAVADQNSFQLSLAPNQANDCAFDPADVPPTPALTVQCLCAPFNLRGDLILPVGAYPYTGLMSWGARSTDAYNFARNFGGYVLHLDGIGIYY